MRIAILDDYQGEIATLPCYHKLALHQVSLFTDPPPDRNALIARLRGHEAIVLIRERTRIDADLLAHLPELRLISQTGKISRHLDLDACTRNNVAVAEGVGSPLAPGELCWALILAASRHIPAYVHGMRAGRWQDSGTLGLGRTLHGRTLGIWSFGKIGRRVAAIGRAFGMRVLIWGSDPSREAAGAAGYATARDKHELFRESDILSLHLRLVPATRACVTANDLAEMKPSALLVNTSRAELIGEGALLAALKAGRPGSAALDVYEHEPLTDSPLLMMPNVLCTPHLGYVTRDSYELYLGAAFENVLAFANGQPTNLANPEVLSRQKV